MPRGPARACLVQVCGLARLPCEHVAGCQFQEPWARPTESLTAAPGGCLARRCRVFRVLPCSVAGCCLLGIPWPDGGPAGPGLSRLDSRLTGRPFELWSQTLQPGPPSPVRRAWYATRARAATRWRHHGARETESEGRPGPGPGTGLWLPCEITAQGPCRSRGWSARGWGRAWAVD